MSPCEDVGSIVLACVPVRLCSMRSVRARADEGGLQRNGKVASNYCA